MPVLTRTSVRELDRVVDGFNRYGLRFETARSHLREAAQRESRDQRLSALGRMTGGIAHEIRNPIAAKRLKAENALPLGPERQREALHTIVGQIDRLEGAGAEPAGTGATGQRGAEARRSARVAGPTCRRHPAPCRRGRHRAGG